MAKGIRTNGVCHHPDYPSLPTYDQLPVMDGLPHGCTWGLWEKQLALDKVSSPDSLGTLNLLTPSTKARASEEITLGLSVALNWSGEALHSGRRKRLHRIIPLEDGWVGNDDELEFNTQGSSQWDGFRHWAHQPSGLFYNGVKHQDILKGTTCRNGIHHWTEAGGIVGRGVLLDYYSWAATQGKQIDPVKTEGITVQELEMVAQKQGVTFLPGDILLIRIGFIKWAQAASEQEREEACSRATWAGVQGNEDTVRWLWDHHFAAVGGDAAVFEAWPAQASNWTLHDNLIALFGMPVGEMFDLERLSEECRKAGKWSFFFTSAPLNIPGGIASPPNAVCVL